MYRNYFFRTLFFAILFAATLSVTQFIIDPFQQYRQARFYHPYFSNQRYMNPGMSKSAQYDSILVGTSTSENFLPSDAKKILGFNLLKLPYNGGTAYEEGKIIETAIRTGKVQNVLLGLDFFSLAGDPYRVRYVGLPEYLYDDNLFNDYQYLLNIQIFIKEVFLKIVPSNFLGFNRERLNRDNPYFWWQENMASKKKVLNFWENRKTLKQDFNAGSKNGDLTFEKFKTSFEINILPHIENNRNVDFYIFFPPYSVLYWVDSFDSGWFEEAQRFKEYLSEMTTRYQNMHLFDFQVDQEIVCDLDNYKDLMHYSAQVNRKILEHIKEREFLYSKQNTRLLRSITETYLNNNTFLR